MVSTEEVIGQCMVDWLGWAAILEGVCLHYLRLACEQH